jgi:folate-dependent phosphoribosylglycinamide formyltransferase PurN
VFLSGGGSNFRSIYDAITAGEINAEVAVSPLIPQEATDQIASMILKR